MCIYIYILENNFIYFRINNRNLYCIYNKIGMIMRDINLLLQR